MNSKGNVWRVKRNASDSLLPLARQVSQWQKQQTAQTKWTEQPVNRLNTRGCDWAAISLGLEAQRHVKN